jgi:hypothetical protein
MKVEKAEVVTAISNLENDAVKADLAGDPAFYEAQHRARQIAQLKWKAANLGFQVVEAAA